jgi:hypothetical protein
MCSTRLEYPDESAKRRIIEPVADLEFDTADAQHERRSRVDNRWRRHHQLDQLRRRGAHPQHATSLEIQPPEIE